MPVLVDTLDELQQHLAPVLAGRAGPDVGQVGPAVLTLLGALLWRKDPGPVEVRGPGLAWVSFGGERYLFRYDPHARQVEVRRGSGSGELLLGVADGTDPAEVVAFVATLGG
jgi:Integron cassette protein VCH_CASS1 chain